MCDVDQSTLHPRYIRFAHLRRPMSAIEGVIPAEIGLLSGLDMPVRTPETLIAEFDEEVRKRISSLKNNARWQRHFLLKSFTTDIARDHSAERWVHEAHLGTLEKLDALFVREGVYESVELVAVARNAMENLIWLKLMEKDIKFGIVFYAVLLDNQKSNQQGFIDKIEAEIALFDDMHVRDKEIHARTLVEPTKKEKLTEEQQAKLWVAHRAEAAALDESVRRKFCLYADDAAYNSYKIQADLLREEGLPRHADRLAEIVAEKQRLEMALPSLVDFRLQNIISNRWNWFERANEVGLANQYRFLYSYSSKLLHSTPLNVITEKHLSKAEEKMFLDYIVITSKDLLDLIEAFKYPGQVNAFFVEFPNHNKSSD